MNTNTPFAAEDLRAQSTELRLADILLPAEAMKGSQQEEIKPKKTSLLYRTKICSYYESGSCKRGEKCAFAHGEANLRRSPNLYKTQLCEDFLSTGVCANMEACTFAHYIGELQPTTICNEDSPSAIALRNLERSTERFTPNRNTEWSDVLYVSPASPPRNVTVSTQPCDTMAVAQSSLCNQCGPRSTITSRLTGSHSTEPFFIPVDKVATSSSYSSVIGLEDAAGRWTMAHSLESPRYLEPSWQTLEPAHMSPPSSPQLFAADISVRRYGNVRSSNRRASPLNSWDEAEEV